MTGDTYKGVNKKEYKAGALIGTGGEGSVYESVKDSDLVLKIYHESITLLKAAKLKRMVAIKDDILLAFSAWPIDILHDARTGQPVGFVMHKLQNTQPIHRLFSPYDRKQYFADCGYNFLVHVAVNLAIAFARYHQHGIMVGDVNEGNIQIQNDGRVIFIDCDSFQVKNNEQLFFCEVGIPRYTAPELLEIGSFQQLERTPNTDIFSLAVLVFQLIFLGRHPFVGVNLAAEDIDEETAIKKFIFPYSVTASQKLSPPPYTLPFNTLSPGLINLFSNTFENRATQYKRPNVELWINELSAYKNSLKICTKSRLHFFSPYAKTCPWCDFIKTNGIYYFADDVAKNAPMAAKEIDYLRDLDYFINDKNLFIEFKAEYFDYKQVKVKNNSYPASFLFKKYASLGIMAAIVIFFGALTILNELFAVVGLTLLILFYANDPFRDFLSKKKKDLKADYESLKSKFALHTKEFNQLPDLKIYDKYKFETNALISKYQALSTNYKLEKAQIETDAYELKLNQFLRGFKLDEFVIQNIGPSRKEKLYLNKVYTAADVKASKINLPGFGSFIIASLLNWRQSLTTRFVYVPDQLDIFRKINDLNKQYADNKKTYAETIVKNITSAKKLEPAIIHKRQQLKTSIQKLSRQLKLAELEYKDFSKRF